MIPQSGFSLKGRKPDILTCIANLSNDEVFTPPDFANRMLDTLEEAWAADNNGASIWADSSVRFLDPCTKSGVFLREITKRLVDGLEEEIPDLEERVEHILTKQVFGMAITKLTGLLARRSTYCSKQANHEKHSICKSFDDEQGNIWFERLEHSWQGKKCRFCGAPKAILDRGDEVENYAYGFIHTDDIKARVAELFGEDMQFDVVIGNPPYQLEADGNTRSMPIYQKFVDAAITLDPKSLLMITPSRWFSGGLGLDDFRSRMLQSGRLRTLVDFSSAGDVFPGVQIKGGVSYFHWGRDFNGETTVVSHTGGPNNPTIAKRLLSDFDVHIRSNEAVPILKKVLAFNETSLSEIVSAQKPFGLQSNQNGHPKRSSPKQIALYGTKQVTYLDINEIPMNADWVEDHKVLVSEAYGASDSVPHQIIGRPFAVPPRTACTQTYLVIGRCNSASTAESVKSYLESRFARFLVSLRKISQHTKPDTYKWVPQQTWDRTWTDEELYKKYKLTKAEIEYIESVIRPMGGEDA